MIQKFCNITWGTPPLDFIQVIKMTNYTGLWDAELAWYSMSATHRIYPYGALSAGAEEYCDYISVEG